MQQYVDSKNYDQWVKISNIYEYESQMEIDEGAKQTNVNCDLITFDQDIYLNTSDVDFLRPVAWIQKKNNAKKDAYAQFER